ncbi:TOBE domain-containing protein [Hydrogenophaga sp.]|uniref:TOBE domain-containing protein n=1 Tax=Hydrogenophaga sp. TaxID=1904254 RepID=UPI0025BE92B3|nr:TOBE domain-containing protein [Hydrogenophaga sp.]
MPRRQTLASPPLPALSQALSDPAVDKRVELLRCVARGGSISQAARETGISYKAAWQAIDTLSNLSGRTLVDRTVGGAGGGGAQITEHGEQLLLMADALAQARAQVIQRLSGAASLTHALGLRTSMRNQLPCVVDGLDASAEDDPAVGVRLRTAGGAVLTASVTRESADLLGLVPGLSVLVMCKAMAVTVRRPAEGQRSGDGVGRSGERCVLCGEVDRIAPGAVRDEVVLALPGGGHWVGFADHPSQLVAGEVAWALMAPTAMVIGLAG